MCDSTVNETRELSQVDFERILYTAMENLKSSDQFTRLIKIISKRFPNWHSFKAASNGNYNPLLYEIVDSIGPYNFTSI